MASGSGLERAVSSVSQRPLGECRKDARSARPADSIFSAETTRAPGLAKNRRKLASAICYGSISATNSYRLERGCKWHYLRSGSTDSDSRLRQMSQQQKSRHSMTGSGVSARVQTLREFWEMRGPGVAWFWSQLFPDLRQFDVRLYGVLPQRGWWWRRGCAARTVCWVESLLHDVDDQFPEVARILWLVAGAGWWQWDSDARPLHCLTRRHRRWNKRLPHLGRVLSTNHDPGLSAAHQVDWIRLADQRFVSRSRIVVGQCSNVRHWPDRFRNAAPPELLTVRDGSLREVAKLRGNRSIPTNCCCTPGA